MNSEIEYYGFWKLPDAPNWELTGILKLTAQGIFLDLIGSFDGIRGAGKFRNVILGQTNKGDITLLNCNFYKGGYSSIDGETYKVTYCFVGHHFNSEDDIAFSVVAVNYKYIEYWSCEHGFEKEFSDRNNKRGKKYLIEYKQPKPILLSKSKDLKIFLFFSVNQKFVGKFNRSGSISEKTFLNFYFPKPHKFSHIESLIFSLKLFFTIATTEKTRITRVDLWLDDPKEQEIKLFISECLIEDTYKVVQDRQMLFSLNDIKDKVANVFKGWLSKTQEFKTVFELYYDIIYNEKRYGRTEFLSLVSTLETIHRSAFKDVSKKKMTLRERIKDIYDEYKIAFEQFESNRDEFVGYVVDTRNYYVHLDEKNKPRIIQDERLFYFNYLLRILVDLLILSLIGFEKTDLPVLIKKSHGSRYFSIRRSI